MSFTYTVFGILFSYCLYSTLNNATLLNKVKLSMLKLYNCSKRQMKYSNYFLKH